MDRDDPTPWDLLASAERWPTPNELTTARYAEQGRLGRGGMGEVVVAEDLLLHRKVALKRALGDPDGPEAQRLRREARITAALDHPGIVPVYDVGEDGDGHPHFVMRLVRGESLAARIAAAHTQAARRALLRPLLAACEAVAFAHDAGVIHRDLKPENIMVGPRGETQVMDWGLARASDSDAWERVLSQDFRTRMGAVLGTPAYMSPEQASGGEVGPASDVWALGAILYELLSGQRMVRGATDKEMLAQILTGSRPPIAELADVPDAALSAVVERALDAAPTARYPNAGELADALRAALEEQPRRATARLGFWPALLVAAVLAVGAGWLLARSTTPPSLTEDTKIVQRGLVLEAQNALSLGETGRAEALAHDALSRGDHPGARGILAMTGATTSLLRTSSVPLPHCESTLLPRRGGFLICKGPDEILRIDLAGAVQWRVPVAASQLQFDGAEALIAARPPQGGVLFFDAATGSVVSPQRMRTQFVLTRTGLSRKPNEFVELHNGREPEFFVSFAEDRARGTRHPACVGRGGVEFAAFPLHVPALVVCGDDAVVTVDEGDELLPPAGRPGITWTGALDDSERWLLLGEVDGVLEVIDLKERARSKPFRLTGRTVGGVALSPDGALGAMIDTAGVAWVFRRDDPFARARVPGQMTQVGFSADGALVVVRDRSLEHWTVPPLAWARRELDWGIRDADWGPSGLAVVSNQIHIFGPDARPGPVIEDAQFESDRVPDQDLTLTSATWVGDELAVAGYRAGVWWWRPGALPRQVMSEGTIAVSLANRVLVLGGFRASPKHVSLTGEPMDGLWIPRWRGAAGRASRDGHRALLVGRGQSVPVLVEGEPPEMVQLPQAPQATGMVLSEDGSTLYYTNPDGLFARAPRAEHGTARLVAEGLEGTLTLDATGEHVFVGTAAGELIAVHRPSGRVRMRIDAHTRRISTMVLSPDGTQLATGSWDRTLARWDLGALGVE